MFKFPHVAPSVVLIVLAIAITHAESTAEHNKTLQQHALAFADDDTSHLDDGMTRQCLADDDSNPLDEFPDIFDVDQLRQGWVALHVFAAVYFFILLAMVCNHYFLPTVECICEDLNLPKDVAAATFMATATSMPEFFTNTISTLITNSDMGLGTIIGSLMFNTLGVAGVAALAINKPIQLDWWPIVRDCAIYVFNTVVLLILAWRGSITFADSCILVGLLLFYYLITFNNHRIMPTVRKFVEDKMNCCFATRYDFSDTPEINSKAKLPYHKKEAHVNGLFTINLDAHRSSTSSIATLTDGKSWSGEPKDAVEMPEKLFSLPRGQSKLLKFWWAFTWPIKFVLSCIIPNPLTCRKLYPLSFIMCIVVIGGNAYMIVWMLTALGVAINVPTVVMGLTFLAAGSATPECVSSVISLRNGESGIGVSNSLGANSLAILLSLGFPWFIKNCINYGKENGLNKITIATQGIQYNIMILLACTFALFIILSVSGYRLTKKAGTGLLTIYGVLVVLQVLIELNIFFPERC